MNILVVGASSGIGEAVARELYAEGHSLLLVARREEKLVKLQTEFLGQSSDPTEGEGRQQVYVYPYDITELEGVGGIFEYAKKRGFLLDGMVFSAGINRDQPIRSNDIDDMNDVMDTNVLSFVELCKYFSKKKVSSEGASVVAISSIASRSATAGMCTYTASKAALNSVVKVFAREMTGRRIRVNAILPGFVDTEMAREAADQYGEIAVNQPLGVIVPEQLAYAVAFLLSDKARYITGSLMEINGGDIG